MDSRRFLNSYLVISGSVTRSLAFQATLRQSAPTVSIHRTGTSPQPTSSRPSIIPENRPPPPTDTTIAPGLDGNEALSSCTILEWPFLKDLNNFSFLVKPKTMKEIWWYSFKVLYLQTHQTRGWLNGCITVRPSLSAKRRASAFASSHTYNIR